MTTFSLTCHLAYTAAEYFTVREILAEASTVRPKLAAEGSLIHDLPPAIREISGQAILAGVGV
jgi:hypothetical protein